jgi:flagellar basal body-associated protein FliL
MKKNIIIIAVAVIALGVGAYFLLFRDKDGGKDAKVITYDFAIEDPFITNVKRSEKLLKTSVILVVDKKDLDEFLDKNLYTLRDTVLFILRELTEEDITNTEIQNALRGRIADALNQALDIDNIVNIKFSDFVMQ